MSSSVLSYILKLIFNLQQWNTNAHSHKVKVKHSVLECAGTVFDCLYCTMWRSIFNGHILLDNYISNIYMYYFEKKTLVVNCVLIFSMVRGQFYYILLVKVLAAYSYQFWNKHSLLTN